MTHSASERDAGPFTIPNLVSLVRLLCIPLFLWLLFGVENRVAAAALLAILGATDWVDGYLARRLDQVSAVGKLLDPAADRAMFVVAVLAMIVDGSIPLWFAVAVLVREVVVSVAVLILAALGARRIDVTWWGKAGTFGLMVTFPLFLLGSADIAAAWIWESAAWIIGVPSLVISYYAAFAYVPLARRALAEGRGSGPANSHAPVEVESTEPRASGNAPPRAMG